MPPGRIESGSIRFQGKDLLAIPIEEMRDIRGNEIAMIFQEPMTALNPVFTVGFQLVEAIRRHSDMSKQDARKRAAELLTLVGIPDAEKRLKRYPQAFSGGMRQRAMIAIALAMNPRLLIADEPTTALDVTIQAQILELMIRLREEREGASILLITHDLGVVAETCDRVAVMYGGKIQEIAPVEDLFGRPLHPYTQGLLASLPRPDRTVKPKRLPTVPGIVPSVMNMPVGCKFVTRCPVREARCETEEPELREVASQRTVRCHLVTSESDAPVAFGEGAAT